MIDLRRKLKTYLTSHWPLFLIFFVVCIFFWKVFLLGYVPIPGDFIVGTYYPWLDYKWGYSVGVPVKNPITSDVVSVIYPIRSLAVDILKSGKIPLWNSRMFAGYPLLANFQVAILSPTFLFYFFLSKSKSWTIQIILQPLLATYFAFLYLRNLKRSKLASLIGGLVYAFSGFSMIWLEWNAHSLVAAWIPLILLMVDKFIRKKSIYLGLILSLLIVLQIFSGYPQLVFYTFIAIAVLLVFRKAGGKEVVLLFLFITWGVLLSSIQSIPALELLINSQRFSEKYSSGLSFLPYQYLISFFAPDFFGNHATGNFWGVGNYTNNVAYSGLVAFILAMIGYFSYKKYKETRFLVLLFFLSIVLSVRSPLSNLINNSGFFGFSAASGSRALVLANFSVACLSGFGFDKLLQTEKRQSVWVVFPPFAILVVALFYSWCTFQTIAVRNLLLPLFLVVAVWFLLLLRSRVKNKITKYLSVLFIGLIVIAELFRFGWKYTPFSPREFIFPETPLINYLKQQKNPKRIYFGNVIPMNMWVPYELESLYGYDAVYPESMAKYIAVVNSGNINVSAMGRFGFISNYNSRLLDLANVKYFLFLKKEIKNLNIDESKFRKVFQDKSVTVFENMKVLDRAYMVYDWEILKDENFTLARLLDDDFPINEKIILDEETRLTLNSGPALNSIEFVKYSPQESSMVVKTNKDGLLFVSDSYYPGWYAYVDELPTKIYRADYIFRAIEIPEGVHNVQFVYRPESFTIGVKISLISFMGVLVVVIYGKRLSKKSRRAS